MHSFRIHIIVLCTHCFADWFITGDVAMYKDGVFRIVGRSSVDIIKSGGYKIGALDIEATLLEHDAVSEVRSVTKYKAYYL